MKTRISFLMLALVLPLLSGCAQEIAGLSRAERFGLYSGAAALGGEAGAALVLGAAARRFALMDGPAARTATK